MDKDSIFLILVGIQAALVAVAVVLWVAGVEAGAIVLSPIIIALVVGKYLYWLMG